MLIVSRNKAGDFAKIPMADDISFTEDGNTVFLDEIITNGIKITKHSFEKGLNLIYVVCKDDLKGIAKKEYLHATLYLYSGLVLNIYNLSKCNYELVTKDGKEQVVSLEIDNNKYSRFQKMIFSHLDIQNIIVYTIEKDMEYDISTDTLNSIKPDESKKTRFEKNEVDF